jgi:hypothetical protein
MAPAQSAEHDMDGKSACTWICVRLHANQDDKLENRFTYAVIVDMIHDEEDDQGERLINEGMHQLQGTTMLSRG